MRDGRPPYSARPQLGLSRLDVSIGMHSLLEAYRSEQLVETTGDVS